MQHIRRGTSVFALAVGLAGAGFVATPAAAQQVIVVPAGTTDTTQKTVGGTDSVTVEAGGTLQTTTNPAINWSTSSTDLRITNSGTIRTTNNGGRAIGTSGGSNPRTVTLTNNAGGLIESQDDAFRINVVPTSGTITVNNAGIIRTTNGGQALDFDGVSGGATIVINNLAGGELRSFGQDAIRPGQGAVVTNAGLIFSDGPANNSYDGVDWQGRSGTVNNLATGTISGLRHGITSDVNVTVTNAGTILGRNGSGIGSDGTGTVVNTGTITGQWDGVAINGDGDGVDIDFIGSVTNSGIIQGLSATGVDSGGRPNSAEGIAMGGGTIINNAGALVFGAGNAILINHDTNPGGVADGATTITNAGTIRATTVNAIRLVGVFNDTITNSGTITGGAAGAIDTGDGNDTLNLLTGSVITGTVDGGAGTDAITLGGTGNGSFAGAVNFESLAVNTGSWTLTAPSSFANGITIAIPATLTGNTTTLTGPIAVGGTLVVNQTSDGTFNGTLGGPGTLVKSGAGALTIGNQTSFIGATNVTAGRLVLAGTLPSSVSVASGATLGGTGSIGSLNVASGGIVAPGNSVGTIIVTGNLAQAAGSIYQAETTAAGTSDRIVVGGTATIGSGAQLVVSRDGGTYTVGTRYTLLTATGGVAGSYTLVQTASGSTEFRLGQSANALFVDVARTAASLPGVAITFNQAAVAPALGALGVSNAAYAALTLIPDDAAVRAGLDALSGEVHASVRTGMVAEARAADDAVRARLGADVTGISLWAQGVRRGGSDDGIGGTVSADREGWGVIGGVDAGIGETVRVGVAGSYTDTTLDLGARSSSAKLKTTQALAYAGAKFGSLSLRGAVGYAWVKNRTARTVQFAGFADAPTARYDGNVLHGFGEVGYAFAFAGGTLAPFAGAAAYRVHSDGFTEMGGAAALSGSTRDRTYSFSSVGLRGTTPIVADVSARASAAWQHALDGTRPDATLRFGTGGVPFTVLGTALSRDAAAVSLDVAWTPAHNVTLSAGYAGIIGDRSEDSSLRAGISIGF